MYVLVAVQLVVLAGIVAVQEINRLWDASPGIPLEFSNAYGSRDPFKGAFVSGQAILSFATPEASVPGDLRVGDKVLVVFALQAGKPPRVMRVERTAWKSDPLFTAGAFSLRGTIREVPGKRGPRGTRGGILTSVGNPAVTVELHLPTSISVDATALDQLAGPSLVEATLRQGFLGHRYLTDVRITGRGLTEEAHFAYDEGRDRVLVLAPLLRRVMVGRSDTEPPGSLLRIFDGVGNDAGGAEIAGHLLGAAIRPEDGTLWSLLSTDRWARDTVHLVRVDGSGQLYDRSPLVRFDRLLGFDTERAGLWVLSGDGRANQPPFFVERLTSQGLLGPRFGPFSSRPTRVVSRGSQIWVLEASLHRLTRFTPEGRLDQEYRDLNQPADMAPDSHGVVVIDAARTQLGRFALDGRLLWRVPRFTGLSFILPDGDSGGGWVGALRLEGQEAGLFRYEADGRIGRIGGPVTPRAVTDWQRLPLGAEAYRSATTGRFYVRAHPGIVILDPDGSLVRRIEGIRLDTPRQVRR
jgi:hypothetical protein